LKEISHIPAAIIYHRKKKGWNQEKLAEESGLKQTTISKMENGESITLENLIKVANALDVSLDELTDRKDHLLKVEESIAQYANNPDIDYLKEINTMYKATIERMDKQNETYEGIISRQAEQIDDLKETNRKLEDENRRLRD